MAAENALRVGPGGLPFVHLVDANSGAEANVHLNGATITHFSSSIGGPNLLFLSSKSAFEAGKAIRGGVPVIWPQFSDFGSLPRHGFVRTAQWRENIVSPSLAEFKLKPNEERPDVWPTAATLTYTVEVGKCEKSGRAFLRVQLRVENEGESEVSFTGALHTYFAASRVAGVSVHGLRAKEGEKGEYLDNADGRKRKVEEESVVRLQGEVDRVYLSTGKNIVLKDEVEKERERETEMVLHEGGFGDVVVWNPGKEKGATLADLGEGEYDKYVCLEAACVGEIVRVEAGGRWTGEMTILAPKL